MTPKKINYQNQAEQLIKQFNKRQMEAYYAKDSKEAVEKVLSLISEKSSIAFGGSMTISEIGLLDEIRKRDYTLHDRGLANSPEEVRDIYLKSFDVDYYLMSSNAITLDGKLVNIDGNGNRVAALIYGPRNVIVIVGMNKLTNNEQDAINRIGTKAAPPNTIRLGSDTPCSKTGHCHECLTPQTICCQTVITRYSRVNNRIKVILVGEELGY